jgi:hypothetical protein
MDWYCQLHDGLESVVGPEAAKVIGREGTRRDINMVFRWIMRMLPPETLMKQAPMVLGTYARGCSLSARQERAGLYAVSFESTSPLVRGVWEEWAEGTRTFLEVSGASDVTATIRSGGTHRATRMQVAIAHRVRQTA